MPITPTTTDFGQVRSSIVAKLQAGLTNPTDAYFITAMRTEKAADTYPKNYTSIFVIDEGSSVEAPDGSANNLLKQWERRTFAVLIYSQSGQTLEQDELTLLTLAAKVKKVLHGFTPTGQQNNDGCLELSADDPVMDFMDSNGVSLKVRQAYELPVQLWGTIS